MFEALLKIFGSKMISFIPAFLLKKIYSEDALRDEILITFPNSGDRVAFRGNVPEVLVRLNFLNQSNLDIELDRVKVEIWFNQPVARFEQIVREGIKLKGSGHVYLNSPLNVYQVGSILQTQANQHAIDTVDLNIKAYFDSKIGKILKEERIEGIEPKINLQGLDIKNEVQLLRQELDKRDS